MGKHFYSGKLSNGQNIENGGRARKFHDDESGYLRPYLMFDVVGEEDKKNNSIVNEMEIICLEEILGRLMEFPEFLKEIGSIGIITPYLAHKLAIEHRVVNPIRNVLLDNEVVVDCATVDEFQGSERDIIVFSCVRSNGQKNIGFLNDRARINVAITRAKYALWIIGNATFLQEADAMWKALVDDVLERDLLVMQFR